MVSMRMVNSGQTVGECTRQVSRIHKQLLRQDTGKSAVCTYPLLGGW